MSNYNELVQILKHLLTERFYPRPNYIKGLLGDGQGNVLVPGRPDYNYVRFNRSASEKFEAFNKEVSQPVDGLPVLLGELPWLPGIVQVVGVDWSTYLQTGWGDTYAGIAAHAPTHEWPNFAPGSDPLNTYLRAVVPMRTQSAGSGSTAVFVNAYEYDWATGTNINWPGTPPKELGPATPPTGSMRYMGVYLNPGTNTVGVVTGATTVYTDAIEPPRPSWPLNVFPSAYVRLYGGQAGIVERDIRDARRLFDTTSTGVTGSSGGGGSHNLLSSSHPDTLAASVQAGDLIYGNSTPKWARLPIVTGSWLGSLAGTPTWASLPPFYPTGPAGGDLTGTYPNPRVVGLNSIPMFGVPNEGQVLMFTGSAWRPRSINEGGGGGGGGTTIHSICNGRLSLTTAVPITTSDVTAATTLYFTPYRGNQIGLYNGSSWSVETFTERSLSLSGFTINTNYDIFLYNNGGTLTLEEAAWTNDTTRATGLVLQDGIYVKSGNTTRRYLGTIRITGTTGQCEDSLLKRYCWNYYNQVERILKVTEGTNSWTYSTDSYRSWNNSTANRVEVVNGMIETKIKLTFGATIGASGEGFSNVGIGLDSVTVNSADIFPGIYPSSTTNGFTQAIYEKSLAIGYHYLQLLEISGPGITTTFYGDQGLTYFQCGGIGSIIG